MKCNGRVKGNKSTKRVQVCNAIIDDHAIFCPECGAPTQALRKELSARKVFQEQYRDQKASGMRFTVPGILLMVITLALLYSVFFLTAKLYYINNLVILFLTPFLLVPFAFSWETDKVEFSLRNYLSALRLYPRLWFFMLVNVIFYFLLKVICTGYLLTVATDPILHLVRLILVLYWLAVIFPVPYLILKKRISIIPAIKISYKAGAETRWQHFYLMLLVTLLNLVAIVPLGIGLIFTLPLSYRIIHRYYENMDQFKLFDVGRN